MATLFVLLVLILSNAEREITCRKRSASITPTFAPSHSPTPYIPKSYPGNIPYPCFKLRIQLETENLLPLNIEPDPASNINVISQAITNFTGGTIQHIQTPDFQEDDSSDYDEQLQWKMQDECVIDNQKTDTLLPRDSTNIQTGNATVIEHAGSFRHTFTIKIPLMTNESVLYVFDVAELPLYITTDCATGDLNVSGAIYKDDVLVAKTENVTISSRDHGPSRKIFHFGKYISLAAGTEYEQRHELIGGYPTGCDFNNVQLGITRRRLQHTSNGSEGVSSYSMFMNGVMSAQATANSCHMGASLARSEEMRQGVQAMCDTKLSTREDIEHGLFRQHNSQSAIRNFLFVTGSLFVYNDDGTVRFTVDDFPQFDVLEPCVAVDNELNVIYAIGGRLSNGEAVDYIQAFQLNDTLTGGNIVPNLGNWRLDKPRYGSTCFFWKDGNDGKLFVMSGMERQGSEFTSKRDFYQDMRIYPVPDNPSAFIPPSSPRSITQRVARNLIDNKPLLINPHTLYFFGGKTHAASKKFVSRFDLNQINIANSAVLEVLTLTSSASMPLIDTVLVDFVEEGGIKPCYMVFGGQVFKSSQLVGDVQTDYIELFCNNNIETDSVSRRLMEEQKYIPRLSIFDREILRKIKSKNIPSDTNKRRLYHYDYTRRPRPTKWWRRPRPTKRPTRKPITWWPTPAPTDAPTPFPTRSPTPEPTPQVFLRDYDFHKDGIWYNFTADTVICYEENQALLEAVEFYQGIIADIPRGQKWIQWKHEMDKILLDVSLQAYSGWSDGFGCVDVTDIAIIDVNLGPTPTPTADPTPSPTPKPTRMPTVKPTEWPTKKPTAKPTEWPTIKPTLWPTYSPNVCCDCVQINKKDAGCPNNPKCEEVICKRYNMYGCCKSNWGGPCANAAVSKCNTYKTCCGCLTSLDFGGCYHDPECEKIICDKDPLCCGNKWDDICVINANAQCKDEDVPLCCGCAKRSVHNGCKMDKECEEIICSEDEYCCSNKWDFRCAKKAAENCRNSENKFFEE